MPSGLRYGRHEDAAALFFLPAIYSLFPFYGNTTASPPGTLPGPDIHLLSRRVPDDRERSVSGAFAKRLPVGRRNPEEYVYHADSLFLFPGVSGERKYRFPLDQPLRLQNNADTGAFVHGARTGRVFSLRLVHRPLQGPAPDDRRGRNPLRLFYFPGGLVCHGHLRHTPAGGHQSLRDLL